MRGSNSLRDRIAFERRVVASDGYGSRQGAFEQVFACDAQVRAKLGGEAVIASRLAGTQPVSITVRWSPRTAAVTPDWRARNVRTGTIYNIRTVVDPEQHTAQHGQWLEMTCEAGVPT